MIPSIRQVPRVSAPDVPPLVFSPPLFPPASTLDFFFISAGFSDSPHSSPILLSRILAFLSPRFRPSPPSLFLMVPAPLYLFVFFFCFELSFLQVMCIATLFPFMLGWHPFSTPYCCVQVFSPVVFLHPLTLVAR